MQTKGRCVKIGIISDSHARVDLAEFCIKKLRKKGAEFFIHAGDIVKEDTLKLLKKTSLPYKAVLGNNDNNLTHLVDKYNLYKEPYYFKIKSLRVKLMHHPLFLKPDADLIVYGHTHHFEAKLTKKAFFINSGEVCARKKNLCECVLLEIFKHKWVVYRFTCNPKKLKWKKTKKVYRYE